MNEQQPVVLVRGKDRKLYPAQMPPDEADVRRARVLAHNLVCRDRMRYRDALDVMLGYGIKRSAGWMTKTITGYDCGEQCAGRPAQPAAEQQPAGQAGPPAAHVHQVHASGYLTGMLGGGDGH